MKKILIYLVSFLISLFGILYSSSKLYFYGLGHNYIFTKNLPYELVPFYSDSDLGLEGLIFQDKYGFIQIGKRNSNFLEFNEYDVKQYYFNENFLLIKIQNNKNDFKYLEIIPKQKNNYQYFSYNKLIFSDFEKIIKERELVKVSIVNIEKIKILKLIYYFSWIFIIITIILFLRFLLKIQRR